LPGGEDDEDEGESDAYRPEKAYPTERLAKLMEFRSLNPVYGVFLSDHLGRADFNERLQALESVLEMPRSMRRHVRVPEDLPRGPLAVEYLDDELIQRGLVTADQLAFKTEDEKRELAFEDRWTPTLAEKLRLLFDSEFPGVRDVSTMPVWAAGELLRLGGDFNKYVTSHDLTKQEGMIFRHLLRLILLCGEFMQVTPPEGDPAGWQSDLREIADRLTASCRQVDPESTDKAIEAALHQADVIHGEVEAEPASAAALEAEDAGEFGLGLFDED
jgi:hypothetical protein